MDKEQEEIQFLGFFGIYKEALNITISYRKIFSLITLSVVLPLSLIYSAQIEFSNLLSDKIIQNLYVLNDTPMGSEKYSNSLNIILSELSIFLLLKIAYLIFSLILTFFSTSAVVHTIACIYTAYEITYKTVMKVVPKVWKRLMITFIWECIILFALNMGVILIVLLWAITLGSSATGITVAIILSVIYLLGILYMNFVWQLANVISILEDVCGTQALMKSMNLIKGKRGVCFAIFLINNLCFVGIDIGFKTSVNVGVDSVWGNILHACLWSLLMSMVTLLALIIQTIIYFICKSYHHENIDKSSLANYLEVHRRDYVPLETKDVHGQDSMV